jgi:hypothetical protein
LEKDHLPEMTIALTKLGKIFSGIVCSRRNKKYIGLDANGLLICGHVIWL